jgi:hypothetical protein
MKIKKISPFDGTLNELEIPLEGHEAMYARWLSGEGHIQNMLPHLTPAQREFLMTGITQEQWDDTFKPKDPKDLTKHGFEVWQTGGGFTAWRKEFKDGGYVLITGDDAEHELVRKKATVGLYNDEDELQMWGRIKVKDIE